MLNPITPSTNPMSSNTSKSKSIKNYLSKYNTPSKNLTKKFKKMLCQNICTTNKTSIRRYNKNLKRPNQMIRKCFSKAQLRRAYNRIMNRVVLTWSILRTWLIDLKKKRKKWLLEGNKGSHRYSMSTMRRLLK
jgi:hypothetical protein